MNVVNLHAATEQQTPPVRLSPEDSKLYFPVIERPLYWRAKNDNHFLSPDHKQLVRVQHNMTNGDKYPIPIAVVGSNYKVVQNRDLFEAVEADLVANMPPEKLQNVKVHDRLSYDGALSMREYRFLDITTKIGRSDVAFRAIVINGFGNSAIKLIVGAIDMFCLNGIIIGIADRKVRRHTSGLDVTMLAKYITGNLQLFDTHTELWKKWAGKRITFKEASDFFDSLVGGQYLSERIALGMLARFRREETDRGCTLWALVSAMTYYSSHTDDTLGFGIRNTGRDHEAATMLKRSEDVRKIIRSETFRKFAA